jgi:hypothetical protein
MRVYEIQGDLHSGNAVQNRDKLGRTIAALANEIGSPVFFHDVKAPPDDNTPLGGAPTILLECSDDFLERVKKLPGFVSSEEFRASTQLPPGYTTGRDARVQRYFEQGP